MSRKSRRHRRHLPRSKRREFRKGFPVPTQPAATQRYEPAPRAEMVTPVAKPPAPRPAVTLAQPISLTAELQRIGILCGVIVVILVVLALVLH
jgi:hypothetical protein